MTSINTTGWLLARFRRKYNTLRKIASLKADKNMSCKHAVNFTPDGSLWEPGKFAKICSQHFIGGKPSNIQTHPDYNPTIFPPLCKKGKKDEAGRTWKLSTEMEHMPSVDCEINICEEKASISDVPIEQFIKSEPTWSLDENEDCSTSKLPVENQMMIKVEPDQIFPVPGVEEITAEIVKEEHDIQEVEQPPSEPDCILPDAGLDDVTEECGIQITEQPPSELDYILPDAGLDDVTAGCGIQITDMKKEVLDEEYECTETALTDDHISTSANTLKISRIRSSDKMQKEETGIYSCATCEKTFTNRRLLKRHMLLHTGEKPFTCFMCGKAFRVRCNLISHIRAHSGVRPYKCKVCGRAFVQLSNLKSHLTIHSRNKPFVCLKCGKCFSMDRYLKRHMNNHSKKVSEGILGSR